MTANESSLKVRYEAVLDRISSAASASGRDESEITLIVISKNHPAQLVLDLIELGARNFGENRDQEAAPKSQEVAKQSDSDINWHFVGQLQSNKVRSALNYASSIHSLDRDSLLQSIRKEVASRRQTAPNFSVDVFIQLNLTDDPNRGGIHPNDLDKFAESVMACEGLNLKGVMGVAALDRAPEIDFETIAKASAQLRTVAPAAAAISAGMSEDFEKAIPFGATHLRIGTAITGKRVY
jgi:pyridoxal phosphate enzyme (YggS family)